MTSKDKVLEYMYTFVYLLLFGIFYIEANKSASIRALSKVNTYPKFNVWFHTGVYFAKPSQLRTEPDI